MKRYSIIFIVLLASQFVVAQSNSYKNLEKLYQKNNFTKGIEKATEFSKNFPQEAEPLYYLSLFYIQKSNSAKSQSYKQQYLDKSINYLHKVKPLIDTNKIELSKWKHYDFIYAALKEKAAESTPNTIQKTLKYHTFLAHFFKDTTQFYKDYTITVFDASIVPKEDTVVVANLKIERKQLIDVASSLIGIPYKYGGETKDGFDCSGFNLYVYKNLGLELPHNAHQQSELGKKIPIEEAQIGDLIFFGHKTKNGYRANHAGMIYQNDENGFAIIHCVSKGVSVDAELWKSYWSQKVLFVKRIIE